MSLIPQRQRPLQSAELEEHPSQPNNGTCHIYQVVAARTAANYSWTKGRKEGIALGLNRKYKDSLVKRLEMSQTSAELFIVLNFFIIYYFCLKSNIAESAKVEIRLDREKNYPFVSPL